MKIEESSVVLQSRHSFESECKIEISTHCSFRTVFDNVSAQGAVSPAVASDSAETGASDKPGEKIRLMLEQLIAEIIALISGQKCQKGVNIREMVSGEAPPAGVAAEGRQPPQREFVWENTVTETIREHESTDFSASGVIHTRDGQSINFTLDLAMCRDYQQVRKAADSGTVALCDPLVINFDGTAAALDTIGNARFEFDLDSDGQRESLHRLSSGSAFIALDRNGDGLINDGNELFGTRSGDGFADLAALDSDGNHWLDDADTAFASLKAWSRDAGGKDHLDSLKEKGVGAIYLGASETPFALKDSNNHLQAQVRASGVYLREDGRAGSLQQIDLAV